MLAFRRARGALYRCSEASTRRSQTLSSSSVVLCSSGWSLHAPIRVISPVVQAFPYRSRDFSSLLGAGGSPRRKAPPAAPEVVLTLPPNYRLLPDEVHCFVGLNGSGKSQFLARLQSYVQQQQARGELPASCRLATLSLDAHREVVAEHGDRVVADVLGGIGSPTARDLIVRLGLFPVWEQRVRHLSTGEMRKLLLAMALLETPRASVLILDQPFDGLDVRARRQLRWMLGQLTRGFTRLLVETTGAKHEAFAYKTQVLLVANRLEQVFPEIFSHTVLLKKSEVEEDDLEVVAWPGDKEDDIRNKAMMKHLEEFYDAEHEKRATMANTELVSLVQQLFDCREDAEIEDEGVPAVRLSDVSISYDNKRVLLEGVNFVRQRHEHWALLGPNGSGKSSLMRVLMQTPGHGLTEGEVLVVGQQVRVSGAARTGEDISARPRIEAISTDQHIQLLHKSLQGDGMERDQSAFEQIVDNAASLEAAQVAMRLLALPESVKTFSLSRLSQGEQKLALIARALAARPKLLILDEITHGLDPFNRAHVLRVIEAIGQHAAQRTHLVLITHHEEEITSCFSGIFEIQDKQLVERPRQQQTEEETA